MLAPRLIDRADSPPLMQVAQSINGSSLKLCLDAGEARSYPGSGQTWSDLSGNGSDFYLGATSGAEASDPTFNGQVGARRAGTYFSFDGGDYFTMAVATPTWMQNLHKAGAKLGILAWWYMAASGGSQLLFATAGITWSEFGVSFEVVNGTAMRWVTLNNVVGGALQVGSGLVTPVAKWTCIGISIDEAANSGFFFVDGQQAQFSAAYVSPSASNASFTPMIGAVNGSNPPSNGSRCAGLLMWESIAPGPAVFQRVYQATRGRFKV